MVNNKPRRLLVRFSTKEAANIICANAKCLRQADDERKYVYISQDLFLEAAKMEYETRQKRRGAVDDISF